MGLSPMPVSLKTWFFVIPLNKKMRSPCQAADGRPLWVFAMMRLVRLPRDVLLQQSGECFAAQDLFAEASPDAFRRAWQTAVPQTCCDSSYHPFCKAHSVFSISQNCGAGQEGIGKIFLFRQNFLRKKEKRDDSWEPSRSSVLILIFYQTTPIV